MIQQNNVTGAEREMRRRPNPFDPVTKRPIRNRFFLLRLVFGILKISIFFMMYIVAALQCLEQYELAKVKSIVINFSLI